MSSPLREKIFAFPSSSYPCYYDHDFAELQKLCDPERTIIITDDNIARLHLAKLQSWKTIIIKNGEGNKVQATVDHIVYELINHKAGKDSILVGVGGGVVTDITGYVASVYMRGVSFGLVPTSILGMVDAAVGGKNGIDVGIYKNMLGTIRHPAFLLYDLSFLDTLPEEEWINGFAEIIKHGCVRDINMVEELEGASLRQYKDNREKLAELVWKNIQIKYEIVSSDEQEKGERKLLNFGHTFGHAIENTCNLPHGRSVSIGMALASQLSVQLKGLPMADHQRILSLIRQYNLPVSTKYQKESVWKTAIMDKKTAAGKISFVLLEYLGKGVIEPIKLQELKALFFSMSNE